MSILSSTSSGVKKIKDRCVKWGLEPDKVTFNSDGTIDYDGNVMLCNSDNGKLPFKFNVVNGDFCCAYIRLTSLEGAPKHVKGCFVCHNNQLTTLEGCPEEVDSEFDCTFNKLKTLEHSPRYVGMRYDCSHNLLTTLEGVQNIRHDDRFTFNCSDNFLLDLVHSPRKAHCFLCANNFLTTLKGGPEVVESDFDCSHNQLTNLDGMPELLRKPVKYIFTSHYLSRTADINYSHNNIND